MRPVKPAAKDYWELLTRFLADPDWTMEPKLDGFRAVVVYENQTVRLITKAERELSLVFPKVCRQVETVLKGTNAETLVLDGELACFDQNGKVDFNALLKRSCLPRLCVFDILRVNNFDLKNHALIHRRQSLAALLEALKTPEGGDIFRPVGVFADARSKLEKYTAIRAAGEEGVVFKHRLSTYHDAQLPWYKFVNSEYGPVLAGRAKLFARFRAKNPRDGFRV